MYKHGKPVGRLTKKPTLIAIGLILVGLILGYFHFIRPNIKNNLGSASKLRTTVISPVTSNDTKVDEPIFSLTLPGKWKLDVQDWDARYHSFQWVSTDKKYAAGRMFRVYQDTIPSDLAVNYLLPVKVEGGTMTFGTVSDNCVNFTQGAVPLEQRPSNIPRGSDAIPSRWGLVNFLCDNANVAHQVVGASTTEAINTITLTGPTKGKHKFFFTYQDNNISPDYNVMENILNSFSVK